MSLVENTSEKYLTNALANLLNLIEYKKIETPKIVGNKRALLIGINYLSIPQYKLNGCINDATNIYALLIQKFGYKAENIVLMTDNQYPDLLPTKINIINQINRLVSLTKSGDVLFLHYSGHGTQKRAVDQNEDANLESIKLDNCICPIDFNVNGLILDNDLKNILVHKIPIGAKLRAFFDACYSGSILDLEYLWKGGEVFYKQYDEEKLSQDILTISGSTDSQTSVDTYNEQKKEAEGALTMMLIRALINYSNNITWEDLLLMVRQFLHNDGYEQIPMLAVAETSISKNLIDI